MIRVRGMLRCGTSAAEAARITGLSKGAISQDEVCRSIIDEYKSANMRKVDKMVRAGVTVKGACEEYKVTPNSYYVWRKRNAAKVQSQA
jgi:hypothetical protein